MKAVCYVRVSTMEQSTHGVSLEAQEERLLAYCSMARIEVMAMIREEGISGAKPLAIRPGGKSCWPWWRPRRWGTLWP